MCIEHMRGQSTLPMDKVDVHLLSDIIEHFLGNNRRSAELIRSEEETVSNNHNPSFPNEDATTIIEDLTRVVQRASESLEVSECTEYDPQSDVEADFLDLTVHGYVSMKRDYFEECHNPHR